VRERNPATRRDGHRSARADARVAEQDQRARLLAPDLTSKLGERFIKANTALTRMIAELIDLGQVLDQLPVQYNDRTVENLQRIERVANRSLTVLRPEQRPPQARDVIDITVDGQPSEEHRDRDGSARTQTPLPGRLGPSPDTPS